MFGLQYYSNNLEYVKCHIMHMNKNSRTV